MASSDHVLKFILEFDKRTEALKITQGELADLDNATRRTSSSMQNARGRVDKLASSLLKIGISVYGVTQAFEHTVLAGINLNRTIENATMGIGALISANTELANATSLDKFNVAMSETDALMKDIKTASIETAATFPQLTEVFQQAIGGALGAGKAMGQTLDEVNKNTLLLAKRMTNIASSIGMPMVQVNEEIRSIIEGTITADSRIAKMMGLTSEEIKKAKESAGGLAKFLNDEFKDFDVLFGQMTFDKAVARAKDNLDTIRLEATKPLTDDLKNELIIFNDFLSSQKDEWIDNVKNFYTSSKQYFNEFSTSANTSIEIVTSTFKKRFTENSMLTRELVAMLYNMFDTQKIIDFVETIPILFTTAFDKVVDITVLAFRKIYDYFLTYILRPINVLVSLPTNISAKVLSALGAKDTAKEFEVFANANVKYLDKIINENNAGIEKLKTSLSDPLANVRKFREGIEESRKLLADLNTIDISPKIDKNSSFEDINKLYSSIFENEDKLLEKHKNDSESIKKIKEATTKEIEDLNKKVALSQLGQLKTTETTSKETEKANQKTVDNIEKMWRSATKDKFEQNDLWLDDELKTLENSNLLAKDKLKAKDKLYDIWLAKFDDNLNEETEKEKRTNDKKLREDERYIKERLRLFSQSQKNQNELASLSFQKEKLTNPFADEKQFNYLQNIKSIDDEIAQIEKEKVLWAERGKEITDEQAQTWQDNIDFLNDKKKLTKDIYQLENDELLKLERNMTKHFEKGFEDILSGAKSFEDGFKDIFKDTFKDLAKEFEQDFSKKITQELKGQIKGIFSGSSGDNGSSGGFNLNSIFSLFGAGNSGGYDVNAELLNAGYTKQANGDYFNSSTGNTVLAKDVGNLIGQAGGDVLKDNLSEYFGGNSGTTSTMGTAMQTGGYMYAGYKLGSGIGSKMAPNSYANYGMGAGGAVAGAALVGNPAVTSALMSIPVVGWILAAVALAGSFMYGPKHSVQQGYAFKDGMSINGKLDKEELAGIQGYNWYKKKNGSVLGNSASEYI